MWKVTVKGILTHKLRLALTGLAIVLGVTFISGTLVLTDTLHNTFTSLFGNVYQHVDFQVRSKAAFTSNSAGGGAVRTPVPESVAGTVRAVPGVAYAEGSVSGYAQFVAPDGKAISTGGAPTLGVSFDPNPELSSLRVVAGHAPGSTHEIAMDEGTATKYHFHVGERVAVLLTGRPQTFTLSGIVRFGSAENLAGATLAVFDLPTAQSVLGKVGQYDAIDVLATPGADKAAVERAIARALPPGTEVVTGQTVAQEQSNSINQGLSFFSTALLVFAFISLFVGGFTIFNTFSITVGQRTRELALLRIVGASRRQVFRSVLLEAAVLGVVASIVGLGLGVLAAIGLEALLKGFGITLPAGPLVFLPRTVVVALVVGIGVTVVSAISPARRAVAIPPVAALSDQHEEQGESSRRRIAVGGVIAAVGVAALMVGLALVSTIAVFGASLSKSATSSVDEAISADYIITASASGTGGFSQSVAPAAAVKGAAAVSTVYGGEFEFDDVVSNLTAVSTEHLADTVILRVEQGSGAPALAAGDLLIDTTTAATKHLSVGSSVAVTFAKTGSSTMKVGGIFKPNALIGSYLVSDAYFLSHFDDPLPVAVLVRSAPGATGVGAALDRGLRSYPNLQVQTRAQFEQSQQAQVNQLLGLVYALLALAVVIALIGIVNTLMLSVFERTHEIGLLRAVGMRRRQVRAMIRSEAVILALFGAIIGVVIGTGLGVAFADSLQQQGITDLVIPVASLVVFLVLSGLLGLGAASWPARRAARLDVLAAISAE